jgi:hypothetical protein
MWRLDEIETKPVKAARKEPADPAEWTRLRLGFSLSPGAGPRVHPPLVCRPVRRKIMVDEYIHQYIHYDHV